MHRALRFFATRAPFVLLAGVALGLALPDLAASVRPLVVPLSILTVAISMLRVEPGRLISAYARPGPVVASTAIALVGLPMLVATLLYIAGAPTWLATGLTYASAAPPLSSAAAFAILVRIDPAYVTALSLPATLLAPATVWLITSTAPGLGEGVALGALVWRLFAIIAGALAAALILRRIAGEDRVRALAPTLDGLTVLLMTLIGVGIMDEIGVALRADPWAWLGLLALTASLSLISLAAALALLWRTGRDMAFAAGLCASIKNMAVMVAAVLGTVDPRISLVVITAQLPIFFAPLVMRPLFKRLSRLETPA